MPGKQNEIKRRSPSIGVLPPKMLVSNSSVSILLLNEKSETPTIQMKSNGVLVFIDECGSNIALTRLYARSPKGKRACGAIPRNRRANINLLASLSLQGMGEALILEGAADSTAFEIYIEQIFASSLQAGQIVVMDNLSTHTGE